MSQSRELQLHIEQLVEIRSILNSMKNLAFMEIHKLLHLQTMQDKVMASIETAAADFLNFYPYPKGSETDSRHTLILMGAERGFCGDFNDRLIARTDTQAYTDVILVGSRLINRWPDTLPQPLATLAGANVAEEAPAVVNGLIETILALQEKHGFFRLSAVYHETGQDQPFCQGLLPPFQQTASAPAKKKRDGLPPLLNLDPGDFFAELVEHYLFAAVNQLCYASLTAENNRRLHHLEGAVRHLDEQTVKLRRKSQIYRQEEITEEIEVILLNAENL